MSKVNAYKCDNCKLVAAEEEKEVAFWHSVAPMGKYGVVEPEYSVHCCSTQCLVEHFRNSKGGSDLHVPDSLKMLRETFCVAQTRIGGFQADKHIKRLQRLIDECDRQRPLRADGKARES